MQLSKSEYKAREILVKNNLEVFRIKDLAMLLSINKTKAYNLIKALKKKGEIKKAGKGFLALNSADERLIALSINQPSYLSFWSALNHYGFSDQNPKKIFIATTKYSKSQAGIKSITLSRKRFFGYIKSGELTIADKEKSIIDSLLLPKYSGGISEIWKSIKSSINLLDLNKLAEYAFRMESKAVLRRLGFILEKLKANKKIIKKIKSKIGKGYEKLDPALPKRNNLNKTWLLDINYDLN